MLLILSIGQTRYVTTYLLCVQYIYYLLCPYALTLTKTIETLRVYSNWVDLILRTDHCPLNVIKPKAVQIINT